MGAVSSKRWIFPSAQLFAASTFFRSTRNINMDSGRGGARAGANSGGGRGRRKKKPNQKNTAAKAKPNSKNTNTNTNTTAANGTGANNTSGSGGRTTRGGGGGGGKGRGGGGGRSGGRSNNNRGQSKGKTTGSIKSTPHTKTTKTNEGSSSNKQGGNRGNASNNKKNNGNNGNTNTTTSNNNKNTTTNNGGNRKKRTNTTTNRSNKNRSNNNTNPSTKATPSSTSTPPVKAIPANLTRTQRRNLAAAKQEAIDRKQRELDRIAAEKKRKEDALLAKQKAKELALQKKKEAEEAALKKAKEAKMAAQLAEQLELDTVINALESKLNYEQERQSMRELNAEESVSSSRKAWAKNRKKLKADLKKTNAVLKKLKTVTKTSYRGLCTDLLKINMFRHADEAANILASSAVKKDDIDGVIHVASFFHQRYADFTEDFVDGVVEAVTTEENDGSRTTLQLLSRLIAYGLMEETKVFLKIMRKMTGAKLASVQMVAAEAEDKDSEEEEEDTSEEESSSEEEESDEEESGDEEGGKKGKKNKHSKKDSKKVLPIFDIQLTDQHMQKIPMLVQFVKYESCDYLDIYTEGQRSFIERCLKCSSGHSEAAGTDTAADTAADTGRTEDEATVKKTKVVGLLKEWKQTLTKEETRLIPLPLRTKLTGMLMSYYKELERLLIDVHRRLTKKEAKAEHESM